MRIFLRACSLEMIPVCNLKINLSWAQPITWKKCLRDGFFGQIGSEVEVHPESRSFLAKGLHYAFESPFLRVERTGKADCHIFILEGFCAKLFG